MMDDHPALTGTDGSFRIGGLCQGSYFVSAEHSADWAVEPQEVSIRPDLSGTANLLIETGAIAVGTVTAQGSRAPLSGCIVAAVVAGHDGQGLDSALTDASGTYRLRLPSGNSALYLASVTDEFEYPRDQATRTVTVADGQITGGSLDFVVKRGKSPPSPVADAVAHGRVLDPQGQPAPHVLISYGCKPLPEQPDAPLSELAGPLDYTKQDGTYEVKLHPYCDYQIFAGGIAESTAGSKRFNTGSGTSHQVEDLVVRPALSSAAGVVVDQDGRPVANVDIGPLSANMSAAGANAVRSDADGRFQIPHLLDDEPFSLILAKPGYRTRMAHGLRPGAKDLRIVIQQNPHTVVIQRSPQID